MKIVHFIDSLRPGGKERQVVELLKGLLSKDIECELVLMSNNIHYDSLSKFNIRIHYLIRRNKKDPIILFKLFNLCKEIRPDVIHSWDSMTSVYSVPIAKILNIKFVNGMIRDATPKFKFVDKAYIRSKLTFPFSDVIVSNSFAGIKAYNAPLNKRLFIHNGFDFSRLRNLKDREAIKAKFGICTEKIIGMVANFSNNKDYETYIAAAQMILKKRNDVTFLAIGHGDNLDKCKKLVRSQFKDKIKFLGKQQNVESIINVFDVGVLCSHGEAISNSIMEYMALGKPVAATDGGGTKELVLHGETGFLIKSHNANDMGERIEQLLEDKDLAISMGNAGRERIKREFNLEKMTNLYIALYERVLNA